MLSKVYMVVFVMILGSAKCNEVTDPSLIAITGSEAKSYYDGWAPSNAHDGNYNTHYGVKDGDATGNYLKLFLDNVYRISHVDVTNRLDGFQDRFGGTQVVVTTTDNNSEFSQTKSGTSDCGIVQGSDMRSGNNQEEQTYEFDCKGGAGDTIRIRDWDATSVGHGISEVKVYGEPFLVYTVNQVEGWTFLGCWEAWSRCTQWSSWGTGGCGSLVKPGATVLGTVRADRVL